LFHLANDKHERENYRVVFTVELGAVAEGQADGVLGVVGEPGALRHRRAEVMAPPGVSRLCLLQQIAGKAFIKFT